MLNAAILPFYIVFHHPQVFALPICAYFSQSWESSMAKYICIKVKQDHDGLAQR